MVLVKCSGPSGESLILSGVSTTIAPDSREGREAKG